jgi:tetratricopeptide (TPR) repeat protein
MKRVFIVRPFNTRNGIDFDKVQETLITPALTRANLQGDTTQVIFEAGNIREDMFRLLVTADLVIADLSLHNANVYYELGIRHGLRPRSTVMIRTRIEGHDFPFDLQTDRYVEYNAKEPEKKVDDLTKALTATADSQRVDSPVYLLLPDLRSPDPAVLKVVPRDFHEEVQRAVDYGWRGDLRLLAHEARGFEWETEGLRVVGRAQFSLKADRGARETFESLLKSDGDDIEANQRLATVYQRLGDLSASNVAIQRVIDNPASARKDLAEVLSLRARNLKTVWRQRFAADVQNRSKAREIALLAPQLAQAQEAYEEAFTQDMNAYYPGVNALSLLALRIELAEAQPGVWNNMFASDDEASARLQSAKEELAHLAGAVKLCLKANREALERKRNPSSEDLMWLSITEADFAFLVGTRARYVAQRYHEALAGATAFGVDAARSQLELFETLEVRAVLAREALEVVRQFAVPTSTTTAQPHRHVLLFTGHRVDEAGRATPRFPNNSKAEAEAKRLIRDAIQTEKANIAGEMIGIAGGASGGDILFHEICAELGIPTRLYLALPPEQFCVASVQDGGPTWVDRYNRLIQRIKPRELTTRDEKLPLWLRAKQQYSIWQRNNLWMLFNALAENDQGLTLIALWNGQEGDGPGGTRDLVKQSQSRGQKTVILDAKHLAQLQ